MNFLIIAHRGASFDAPENTLAAVNLAWQRNADAVEIDVRLTKDNKIVVIHNSNTWQTSGKFRRVRKQTLQKLKKLDVGKYKGEQWKNERIPLLEDVLATVPEHKKLYIEIKCGTGVFPELKSVLNSHNFIPQQLICIGFELDTMIASKKFFPQFETCWVRELKNVKMDHNRISLIDKMIAAINTSGLDGLSIWPSLIVDDIFISKMKAVNKKLYVWTINDPTEGLRLKNLGVTGIVTDRPQWLKMKMVELETCRK